MKWLKEQGPATWVLLTALAVLLCGATFGAVAGIVWPVHTPVWTIRVSGIVFLVAIALAGTGVVIILAERRNGNG